MREIKFRAFGVLGERKNKWFYGSSEVEKYINTDKRDCHLSLHGFERLIKGEFLDKKTRGEFTGMLDKNGVEIYEGDIVVYDDTPYNVHASILTGVVKMENQSFKLISIKPNSIGYRKMLIGGDDFFNRKSKVIGNIYENPELLESNKCKQ